MELNNAIEGYSRWEDEQRFSESYNSTAVLNDSPSCGEYCWGCDECDTRDDEED